tara:strand:+ start:1028 stop:1264 length:237 start_codon:yes stop_codon:yes gene_type:complete
MEAELEKLKTAMDKIKLNIIRVNDMIAHVNGWKSHGFQVETNLLTEQNEDFQQFILDTEEEIRVLVQKIIDKGDTLKQ